MLTLDDFSKRDGSKDSYELTTPSGCVLTSKPQAQALASVWSGEPVTIVSSPPGAGKSTLVAAVVAPLVLDANLRVTVCAPTVTMCLDMAIRLARTSPETLVYAVGSSFKGIRAPGVRCVAKRPSSAQLADQQWIEVRTAASCAMSPPECDVLVVDEAYQITTATLMSAAERADQILMVGDSGQIGPVTTIDTAAWDGLNIGPHLRAPVGFMASRKCKRLTLPHSYRLGEASVSAIAPLYDFSFSSARRPIKVKGVPEIQTHYLPGVRDVSDLPVMKTVADHAISMIGRKIKDKTVSAKDIYVIAARNQQTAMLSALLAAKGAPQITVGTADLLQGGQRAITVAIDPILGTTHLSDHSASLGRLCVMASRHFAHLSWFNTPDYEDILATSGLPAEEIETHLTVRQLMEGQW